jgi:hypothetical protein
MHRLGSPAWTLGGGVVMFWLLIGQAAASLITINFEGDTDGAKLDGFVPAGVVGVSFSDSVGQDLFVFGFGAQGAGLRSLSVNTDKDGSLLHIDLSQPADFISLDFGNDDPNITNPGDLAVLTGFFGGSQRLQTTLVLNRDDIMNQTITLGAPGGGQLFDFFTFGFTDPYLSPFTGGGAVNVGATEIVDNIQINSVPVPGAMYSLISGLVAMHLALYRRRWRAPERE